MRHFVQMLTKASRSQLQSPKSRQASFVNGIQLLSQHHLYLPASVSCTRVQNLNRVVVVPFATQSSRDREPQREKSWFELASDATQLAKSIATKVGTTIVKAIDPGTPTPKSGDRAEPLPPPPLPTLLPGLFGRALGSVLSGVFQSVTKQLAESSRDREAVLSEAIARIRSNATVRARLGDVQVGPPLSQSVSSSSINGVTSRHVSMVLPLYGVRASGAARAQVVSSEARGGRALQILVQLPGGEVVRIDDNSRSTGTGQVIDVDFREIK